MLIKIDTRRRIFRAVFYVEQLGTKSEVLANIEDFEVSSSRRGTIYFKCFLLPSDLRDVF